MNANPSHTPTTHGGILDWVTEIADLTQQDGIHGRTGSEEEWIQLTDTLGRHRHLHATERVAQAELLLRRFRPERRRPGRGRAYICSVDERDAGPTNWTDPEQMKELMRGLYAGWHAGHTMDVIPFVMSHLDAEKPMFGVEITDSAYVTVSMR